MTRDEYLCRYLANQRDEAQNKFAAAMADLSVANDRVATLEKQVEELTPKTTDNNKEESK